VLTADEARELPDSIETETLLGLRDKAVAQQIANHESPRTTKVI